METKRLNKKLDEAEKEFTHPDDVEYVEGLRKKISDASMRSQYHGLDVSKKIAAFLKQRIKDIKIRLSSEVGLEKVDNLALHARKEENEKLLAFFTDDPKKEIEEIEKEVDGFLAELKKPVLLFNYKSGEIPGAVIRKTRMEP